MIFNPFIWLIKFYQYCISPLLPSVCRYEVTCSQYMLVSIQKYGVIKGIYLGVKRLISCGLKV